MIYGLHVLLVCKALVRGRLSLAQCLDRMLKVRVDFDGKPLMFSWKRPLSVHRVKMNFDILFREDSAQAKDCPNVKDIATDDQSTLLFILC